jgi:hypothetical protein
MPIIQRTTCSMTKYLAINTKYQTHQFIYPSSAEFEKNTSAYYVRKAVEIAQLITSLFIFNFVWNSQIKAIKRQVKMGNMCTLVSNWVRFKSQFGYVTRWCATLKYILISSSKTLHQRMNYSSSIVIIIIIIIKTYWRHRKAIVVNLI